MNKRDLKRLNVCCRLAVIAVLAGLCCGTLYAQATLTITSPATGIVVAPGQSITVSVTASGEALTSVFLVGTNPIGFFQPNAGSSYVFTVALPADIAPGLYTLTTDGFIASGKTVTTSFITIDVERSDNPTSLAVDPVALPHLSIGDQVPLYITGTYADGTTLGITNSTRTTVVSHDPSVAKVLTGWTVLATGAGTTQLVINGSLVVPVSVDAPIAISPSKASLTASQTRNFVARVTNPTDPTVTFSLNPPVGSIDANGLYTAPTSIASQQTVTVTATSVADSTLTASAIITLSPASSIAVIPQWATLYPAQTQQFTATTSNAGTSGVTWSVNPPGTGTISGSGLYTAPSSIASTQSVTITATSAASPGVSGSTTIYISPTPFSLLLFQPPPIALGQGTTKGVNIDLLATAGFAHAMTFSVSGLPSGVTASLNPSSINGAGGGLDISLTMRASTTAPPGTYNVSVLAQDTSYPALSQSLSFPLTVSGGFSMGVSNPTMTTVPGGSRALLATESTTGGFNFPILISAITPSGITGTFPAVPGQEVQQFTGPGSVPILLTASASTVPGSYPITIQGQYAPFGETSSTTMTLMVATPAGPGIVSMSPNPVINTTSIVRVTYSDPAGGAAITSAGVLINASAATRNACYIQYVAPNNTLSLRNNADTGWVGSNVVGTAGSLANRHCTLDVGASQVNVSENNLTLTLVVTRKNSVIGTSSVYAFANDAIVATGFVPLGLWTISSSSLPTGWRDQDIGSLQIPGSAGYDPGTGTFRVSSSGNDIAASPDTFHFTYQPLNGDGILVARLSAINNYFQNTKAGLMIRGGTTVDAPFVYLNFQPQNGSCLIGSRTIAGGTATYTPCLSSLPLSLWMKIIRQGNTFSFQISADGSTWTPASTPLTLPLGQTVFAGLAVVSSAPGGLTTARFNNVSITGGRRRAWRRALFGVWKSMLRR